MTREEEKIKAGRDFIARNYGKEIPTLFAFEDGFDEADKHPKNPWRDAKKELPNDEQLCIVWIEDAVYGLFCKVCRYFASIGFVIDLGEVEYWMPIPELKGGEK